MMEVFFDGDKPLLKTYPLLPKSVSGRHSSAGVFLNATFPSLYIVNDALQLHFEDVLPLRRINLFSETLRTVSAF